MKKLIALGAVLVLFAFPLVSFGAEFKGGEAYTFRKGETVENNFYAAGGNVAVEGDVHGDLVAAGGTVFVNGAVRDDALVAGGTVTILGPVGGDVRIAGGNVTIGGTVGGEVVAAGGTITFLSGAKMAKGVSAGGGQISIDGEVMGDLTVRGGNVVLQGTVHGNVNAKADEKLTLGPSAVINGNLNYTSAKPAEVAQGAKVMGETKYNEKAKRLDGEAGARAGFLALLGTWIFIKFVMTIAAALVMLYLMRPWLQKVIERTHGGFGRETLRGFIMLVAVPAAAFVLFITLIGFVPAVVMLLLYALLLIFAHVTAGVLFGSVLHRAIKKSKSAEPVTWKTAVGGTLALWIVMLIPFLGWIVGFVFFLAAFGAWGMFFYEALRRIA